MPEPRIPDRAPRTSLWQELRDGTAGPGIRVFVSLAAALLLTGLASAAPYFISLLFPSLRPRFNYPGSVEVFPLFACALAASVAYFGVLHWIWDKPLRKRGFWYSAALSFGIWTVSFAACVGVAIALPGDEEFVIFAVLCSAGAATLILWVETWRRYGRGRPQLTDQGKFDVRCPKCDYSMIGLTESRCPECGVQFTLDELLSRQGFERIQNGEK
jgi:hypothetical protein